VSEQAWCSYSRQNDAGAGSSTIRQIAEDSVIPTRQGGLRHVGESAIAQKDEMDVAVMVLGSSPELNPTTQTARQPSDELASVAALLTGTKKQASIHQTGIM
jgi:hypothetical protein